ncbi:hypothetical protein D3C71_980930 [compost metagenome]
MEAVGLACGVEARRIADFTVAPAAVTEGPIDLEDDVFAGHRTLDHRPARRPYFFSEYLLHALADHLRDRTLEPGFIRLVRKTILEITVDESDQDRHRIGHQAQFCFAALQCGTAIGQRPHLIADQELLVARAQRTAHGAEQRAAAQRPVQFDDVDRQLQVRIGQGALLRARRTQQNEGDIRPGRLLGQGLQQRGGALGDRLFGDDHRANVIIERVGQPWQALLDGGAQPGGSEYAGNALRIAPERRNDMHHTGNGVTPHGCGRADAPYCPRIPACRSGFP